MSGRIRKLRAGWRVHSSSCSDHIATNETDLTKLVEQGWGNDSIKRIKCVCSSDGGPAPGGMQPSSNIY